MDAVRQNHILGSTTVVAAKMDVDNAKLLKTTKLGDSEYMIWRPDSCGFWKLIYRSDPQKEKYHFSKHVGVYNRGREVEAVDN